MATSLILAASSSRIVALANLPTHLFRHERFALCDFIFGRAWYAGCVPRAGTLPGCALVRRQSTALFRWHGKSHFFPTLRTGSNRVGYFDFAARWLDRKSV